MWREDGTLYAADLPSGRILRIPRGRAAVDVATVPMPVDLVVDPAGTTLWVASIADGVGLVKVDVASGSVEPFAAVQAAARGGANRLAATSSSTTATR